MISQPETETISGSRSDSPENKRMTTATRAPKAATPGKHVPESQKRKRDRPEERTGASLHLAPRVIGKA